MIHYFYYDLFDSPHRTYLHIFIYFYSMVYVINIVSYYSFSSSTTTTTTTTTSHVIHVPTKNTY